MVRRPPGSTRTARRLPDTPLFRSILDRGRAGEAVLAVHVHRTAAANALAARAAEGQRRILLALHLDERVEHHRAAFFGIRSDEHTSELQSLMRISYAVFCLKKNKQPTIHKTTHNNYRQHYTT